MASKKSTFCDNCVTIITGFASVIVMVLASTVWKAPISKNGLYFNVTQDTVKEYKCNCSAFPQDIRLVKAKQFNEDIEGKDFFGRLHHRITHREEAQQAALCITIILVIVIVALLYTKMWRDKEHYPLTFKQTITFPQEDRETEILVGDMLKSRARNLVKFFQKSPWKRNRGSAQQDETDSRNVLKMEDFIIQGDQAQGFQRELLFSSDDEGLNILESEAKININILQDSSTDGDIDQVFEIDSSTGEWKARREQPKSSYKLNAPQPTSSQKMMEFGRRVARKSKKVLMPKRTLKKSLPSSRYEPKESEEVRKSLLDKSSESDQEEYEPM